MSFPETMQHGLERFYGWIGKHLIVIISVCLSIYFLHTSYQNGSRLIRVCENFNEDTRFRLISPNRESITGTLVEKQLDEIVYICDEHLGSLER